MVEDRFQQDRDNEYSNLAFHPYNVLLVLVLFSLSILFLTLTAAFTYTRFQNDAPPIRLPWLFLVNTLILVGSSLTMMWATRAYKSDQTKIYQQALAITLGLSFLFLIAQFLAWRQLFNQSVFIHTDISASYLYVISGLHFAHVIAGIPFLGYFLFRAHKDMKEPVSVLVYFSDPVRRLKLRLLTLYWHFLDALWIYLILFFFINYLI